MFLPLDEAGIRFDEQRVIPYEPFLGTMGVAPEIEAVNALTPDYYGGNMDCVETRPGNEVWFPVQVEGREAGMSWVPVLEEDEPASVEEPMFYEIGGM